MNYHTFRPVRGLLISTFLIFCTSVFAFQPGQKATGLNEKEFFLQELTLSNSAMSFEEALSKNLRNASAWQNFFVRYGGDFIVYMDPRSATPMNVIGSIPFIPGTGKGNNVTLADISQRLFRSVAEVDSKVVADLFRKFIEDNVDAFAIDPNQLGEIRAVQVNDYLWQIHIPQQVNGIPVRWGRFTGTINHGNLILLGTENWGNVKLDLTPKISSSEALRLGFNYAGGQKKEDILLKEPALEIIPVAPLEHASGQAFVGPLGSGYRHRLAWSFLFQRPPGMERWEVLLDAHSGQILAFEDKNHYIDRRITGGVYPLTNTGICPDNRRCGTMQPDTPMPYANTGLLAPNDFTNSAGIFDYTSGTVTTSLNGRYIRMVDACGAISESASGSINLGGSNGQTDCVSGGTSPGNTPASRSGFYELNRIHEAGRGYLPTNSWLQSQLTANMNLNANCNAFWDGTTVNFYRSGGGCRNSGEIAAVFDHEWGHGLDDNDTNGTISNSGEGYADIASMYRLWASCVGYGFFSTLNYGCGQTSDGTGFNVNESQTGSHCSTDCSGVRDSDYAKHADGLPDGISFICNHCMSGTGPCGLQVHCAATPVRQAAWDLVDRDLPAAGFDANTSFILGDKLFYQGSGNIGNWHNCTCPATGDGCGATNGYMQWIAADDDNGNLNDGTPHMMAIYNAYNRHNIACSSPAPTNSGCSGGPSAAPTLTVSPGSNQNILNWTPVAGAVNYYVFRGDGYAGCNFGKVLIATVSGTTYTDTEVANGRQYAYVVMAVGSSSACLGPASNCALATPQPCAGSVSLDSSSYSCSDVISISLVDSDLLGNGTQNVSVTSTTETTPETVTLTETPPSSGQFVGSINTTSALPAADGLLSVANGDTITVTYSDASYCGLPQDVSANATADCVAPSISNVQVTNITESGATVTWNTNEAANSRVTYGLAPGPPSNNADDLSNYNTSHSIQLTGLNQCSDYVFSVTSSDVAGNTVTDDNSGSFYTFTTGGVGTLINDDAEAGSGNWTPTSNSTNIWHVSTCTANSGTNSFKAGPTGCISTYVNNLTTSLTSAGTFTLPVGSRLRYNENYDTESGYDFCTPQISTDGGSTWTDIATYSGNSGGWISKDYDLSPWAGANNVKIRFLFTTDSSITATGWYIDDIRITKPAPCTASLEFNSAVSTDVCGSGGPGAGDGMVDPGENVVLQVVAANIGLQNATNVSATLSTSTPGITITDNSATFPDIPAESSATSNAPHFAFSVDQSVACGTVINFAVDFISSEGSWTDNFTVLVGAYSTVTLLTENFSSGIPGSWTILDGGSGGGPASTWTTANPGSRTIGAPFSAPFAIVDSDAAGTSALQDEQLITPLISTACCGSDLSLQFSNQFRWFDSGGDEQCDVDVSNDGGSTWTNVLKMQGASNGYPTANTKTVPLPLDPNIKLRFHYYQGNFEWWWAIDNVQVTCSGNAQCNTCGQSCPTITITPATLPDGLTGTPYSQTLTGNGGTAPYSFAVTSGSLPGGLTLNCATGEISGQPTTPGSFNSTITATDYNGCTGSQSYTVNINQACLFCDDFEDGTLDTDWNYIKPAWSEDGDNLIGTPAGRKAIAVASPAFPGGCQICCVQSTMMTAGGDFTRVWMLGWYLDKRNSMELMMKQESNRWILKQRSNGTVVAKNKAQLTILPNTFYKAEVCFDGTQFTVSIDDNQVIQLTPNAAVPTGVVGFQVKATTGTFGYITVN